MFQNRSISFLLLSIVILIRFSTSLNAQIEIGEWRTHLPYFFAFDVMVTDDKAFCTTTGGLFSYGLDDFSLQTLSKTDGLSDNGVSTMRWSPEDELAILAYENGNIDILNGSDVINMPEIYKKQIPGDKSIYHIYFRDKKAYLSCGFGIVVIDLVKYEIVETYYIGNNGDALKVNQVVSDDMYLYAATEQGIRRASLDNPFLIDFNSWELLGDLPNYSGPFSGIEFFGDKLFVMYDDPSELKDRLYYLEGSWQEYAQYEDAECFDMRTSGDYLVISGTEGAILLSLDLLIVKEYTIGSPKAALIDQDGILWIADYGRGLVRLEGEDLVSIIPNGPYSSVSYDMESSGDYFYSVSGGVTVTFGNLYHSATLQTFHDDKWNYAYRTDFRDQLSLAIDPEDPQHVFAATWGYGLAEYKDGELANLYNESNSSLQNPVPGANVIRMGGIAFDSENNLWMTNTSVAEPLSVFKADGTWKSFSLDGKLSDYTALGDVVVSENDHIWGIIPKGHGLFVYNHNGTIDDEEDDEFMLVSLLDENENLITNQVYSLAEDHNGNLWVGTNQGILVLYSPERIFTDGNLVAQDICIGRDDGTNNCDQLLVTQKVTCIEVDGGNRKWLGTEDGGAFLVSESGYEMIYELNISNSSILSNTILDICVDGKSGEVFFGTENGLVSFRGEATLGADNFEDVKVFPNPVRESFQGNIAITGLMEETSLKITDVGGNLVRELESFGGQALWDGKDFQGNRVATGVYLVFMASMDNSQIKGTGVTKILFIH